MPEIEIIDNNNSDVQQETKSAETENIEQDSSSIQDNNQQTQIQESISESKNNQQQGHMIPKSRFDQVVFKQRNAERKTDVYSERLSGIENMLSGLIQNQNKEVFKQKQDSLKAKLEEAISNADIEKAMSINAEIENMYSDILKNQTQQQQNLSNNIANGYNVNPAISIPQGFNQQQAQQYAPSQQQQVSPDIIAFQARNPWYGTNAQLTNEAYAIEQQINNRPESLNMTDAQVYLEIENVIKASHPELFKTQGNYGALGSSSQTTPSKKNKIVVTKQQIQEKRNFWGLHDTEKYPDELIAKNYFSK